MDKHRKNNMSYGRTMLLYGLGFLLGGWALCVWPVAPTANSAKHFIESNANALLKALDVHKGDWEKRPKQLEQIVRKIILPHMESTAMARSTVGRSYWLRATAKQRHAFVRAFETMVIRTYSTAFQQYDGERVEVLPTRLPVRNDRILINTMIHLHNGTEVVVDYHLVMQAKRWMIDDFNVEGVSLVQNYRAQFSDQIHAKDGLAGLTNTLDQHNKKTAP